MVRALSAKVCVRGLVSNGRSIPSMCSCTRVSLLKGLTVLICAPRPRKSPMGGVLEGGGLVGDVFVLRMAEIEFKFYECGGGWAILF